MKRLFLLSVFLFACATEKPGVAGPRQYYESPSTGQSAVVWDDEKPQVPDEEVSITQVLSSTVVEGKRAFSDPAR